MPSCTRSSSSRPRREGGLDRAGQGDAGEARGGEGERALGRRRRGAGEEAAERGDEGAAGAQGEDGNHGSRQLGGRRLESHEAAEVEVARKGRLSSGQLSKPAFVRQPFVECKAEPEVRQRTGGGGGSRREGEIITR